MPGALRSEFSTSGKRDEGLEIRVGICHRGFGDVGCADIVWNRRFRVWGLIGVRASYVSMSFLPLQHVRKHSFYLPSGMLPWKRDTVRPPVAACPTLRD